MLQTFPTLLATGLVIVVFWQIIRFATRGTRLAISLLLIFLSLASYALLRLDAVQRLITDLVGAPGISALLKDLMFPTIALACLSTWSLWKIPRSARLLGFFAVFFQAGVSIVAWSRIQPSCRIEDGNLYETCAFTSQLGAYSEIISLTVLTVIAAITIFQLLPLATFSTPPGRAALLLFFGAFCLIAWAIITAYGVFHQHLNGYESAFYRQTHEPFMLVGVVLTAAAALYIPTHNVIATVVFIVRAREIIHQLGLVWTDVFIFGAGNDVVTTVMDALGAHLESHDASIHHKSIPTGAKEAARMLLEGRTPETLAVPTAATYITQRNWLIDVSQEMQHIRRSSDDT